MPYSSIAPPPPIPNTAANMPTLTSAATSALSASTVSSVNSAYNIKTADTTLTVTTMGITQQRQNNADGSYNLFYVNSSGKTIESVMVNSAGRATEASYYDSNGVARVSDTFNADGSYNEYLNDSSGKTVETAMYNSSLQETENSYYQNGASVFSDSASAFSSASTSSNSGPSSKVTRNQWLNTNFSTVASEVGQNMANFGGKLPNNVTEQHNADGSYNLFLSANGHCLVSEMFNASGQLIQDTYYNNPGSHIADDGRYPYVTTPQGSALFSDVYNADGSYTENTYAQPSSLKSNFTNPNPTIIKSIQYDASGNPIPVQK